MRLWKCSYVVAGRLAALDDRPSAADALRASGVAGDAGTGVPSPGGPMRAAGGGSSDGDGCVCGCTANMEGGREAGPSPGMAAADMPDAP
jgi:hypothetical protein